MKIEYFIIVKVMAERKSIVPSIQIPDSDLRSENKVPSATELLEQDKRLSSLGV